MERRRGSRNRFLRVLTECFSPSRRHKALAAQAGPGDETADCTKQPTGDVDRLHVSRASPNLSADRMTSQTPSDRDGPCDMDLTYITERMIALTFPSSDYEAVYRRSLQQVARMLHDKHEDNYEIINLSERRAEIQKYNDHVLDLGWPASLAPPLEKLCAVCKSIDSWLSSDSRNVVVLHCRAGLGRLGVVIASFIHYSGICASEEQSLDRYAMRQFYDDKLSAHVQPSQRRYVHYFDGLLSGAIMVIPQPLFIHQMSVMGIPVLDDKGTKVFFKIYQAIKPIHTTPIYTVTGEGERLTVGMEPGVQLQGDILIKCYHKSLTGGAQPLFRCQFHTSTVPDLACSFSKHQLDGCCSDVRFGDSTKLELFFSRHSQTKSVSLHVANTPVDYSGTLERWDSYEDFNTFSTVTTIVDGNVSDNEKYNRVRLTHVKEKILSTPHNQPNNFNKLSSNARQQTASPSVKFAGATSPLPNGILSSYSSSTSTTYQKIVVDAHSEPVVTQKTPLLSKSSHTRVNFSESTDSTSPYSLSSSSGVFSNSSASRETDSPVNAAPTKTSIPVMASTKSSTNSNSFYPQVNGDTNSLDQIISELLQDDSYLLSNPHRPRKPTAMHSTGDYKLPPNGTVPSNAGNASTLSRTKSPNPTLQRAATLNDEYIEHVRLGEPVTVEIPFGGQSRLGSAGVRPENGTMRSRSSAGEAYSFTSASPAPPTRTHPVGEPVQQVTDLDAVLQNRPAAPASSSYSRGYFSDSEEPMSWLDSRRYGYGGKFYKRTEQEKRLVDELKSSMRRRAGGYSTSGAESDSEPINSWMDIRTETVTKRTVTPVVQQNGPTTLTPTPVPTSKTAADQPDSVFAAATAAELRNAMARRDMSRSTLKGGRSLSVPDSDDEDMRARYRTEKRYFVSGLERTPAQNQTKYTFSQSSDGEPQSPMSAKPPASPAGPSQQAGNRSAGPSLPPRGASSRDAVSTIMRTQYHGRGQGHVRHHSESGAGSYSTLPTRLRSATPVIGSNGVLPTNDDPNTPVTTSREGYFTFGRRAKGSSVSAYATLPRGRKLAPSANQKEDRGAPIVRSASAEPTRANFLKEYVDSQLKQMSRGYDTSKADELERSIQDLLSLTSQPAPRMPLVDTAYEQRTQQFRATPTYNQQQATPTYNQQQATPTYNQQQAPAQPRAEYRTPDVDEDVISLQPIGRGVLSLEPEGTSRKTPLHLFTDNNVNTLSNRGGTMSRQATREADVASQQQVLHEQSVGRASMSTPAGGYSSGRMSSASPLPRTSHVNGGFLSPTGSYGGDVSSAGPHSPAMSVSSSDGLTPAGGRRGSSNFNDMLAALQQKHEREAPRPSSRMQVVKVGSSAEDTPAQTPNAFPTDWSPAENRPSRDWSQSESRPSQQQQQVSRDWTQSPQVQQVSRDWTQSPQVQQVSRDWTQSPQVNNSQINRGSATEWRNEVTSTMVRRSSGQNNNANGYSSSSEQYTTPVYNGPAQRDVSSSRSPTVPLLQNGLNGNVRAADVDQLVASLGHDNSQQRSFPNGYSPQRADELPSQDVVCLSPSSDGYMSAGPGGGGAYNGLLDALEVKYGVEKAPISNAPPRDLSGRGQQNGGPPTQGAASNPADIGLLIDALEYKHGPDTTTLSRQQVNGGRPSSAGSAQDRSNGGVARSTNPQSPQYFTGGQQPITPNFPVSPGTGGGPMRQTSEYTNSLRTPNSADGTPPVFMPNSADRQPVFNGPSGNSNFVQHRVNGQQVVNSGQLTIDTSAKTWDQPGYSPSSGSGQSPAVPGNGGVNGLRTLSRQGVTSPTNTLGRDDSLALLLEGNPEILPQTPKFVHDMSRLWYKPKISRDEAIALLKDKPAGSFIVRDSNTFEGSFGLAVKVSQLPPNVQAKGGDPMAELVRHFLIEPTAKGVKIKGCSNEPTFTSLAALVYQHSILPMALPCKLLLPEAGADSAETAVDGKPLNASPNSVAELLAQGVACNVLFVHSVDMECLTGPQAVAKAISETLTLKSAPKSIVVQFKVSSQGITVTDNMRKLFFRRHYPVNTVTFCGLDPEGRGWRHNGDEKDVPANTKLFGLIAKKQGSATENACHIFAELDPSQPASAIVNFITKVMMGQGRIMKM